MAAGIELLLALLDGGTSQGDVPLADVTELDERGHSYPFRKSNPILTVRDVSGQGGLGAGRDQFPGTSMIPGTRTAYRMEVNSAGVEPASNGVRARRSGQLSYESKVNIAPIHLWLDGSYVQSPDTSRALPEITDPWRMWVTIPPGFLLAKQTATPCSPIPLDMSDQKHYHKHDKYRANDAKS